VQEESPILVMCHQIASHPIEHERNHLIGTFHDASATQGSQGLTKEKKSPQAPGSERPLHGGCSIAYARALS